VPISLAKAPYVLPELARPSEYAHSHWEGCFGRKDPVLEDPAVLKSEDVEEDFLTEYISFQRIIFAPKLSDPLLHTVNAVGRVRVVLCLFRWVHGLDCEVWVPLSDALETQPTPFQCHSVPLSLFRIRRHQEDLPNVAFLP
jgi:hypothetical protein